MKKYIIILLFLATNISLFESCQKTKETIAPPLAPTLLNANAVSTSQIDLSWSDNSTAEEGFKIERKTGSENFKEIATITKDITTYQDKGLTKLTSYTYRVYAYNNGGKSPAYTNEATATTFNDIPNAATNLIATASAFNKIDLTWEDKSLNETGYKVERKTGTDAYVIVATLTANSNSYKDETVNENIEYTYRVFPLNASGNGAYSNEAKAKTPFDIISGLAAYYPFTGNAGDSSGNGNHGTVYGASLTTDRFGNSNKSYSFNGIDNYIEITNKFFNNGWVNMTISLWFNPNSDSYVGGGRTFINTKPHGGLGFGYNYAGSKSIYLFKNSNPDNPGWDIFSLNNSNAIPPVNQWTNVIILKNGLSYSYYINGIFDKKVETSITPIDYNCSLFLGCIEYKSEFFQGKMDDIRIYNRALSAEQISYLATQ